MFVVAKQTMSQFVVRFSPTSGEPASEAVNAEQGEGKSTEAAAPDDDISDGEAERLLEELDEPQKPAKQSRWGAAPAAEQGASDAPGSEAQVDGQPKRKKSRWGSRE
mmetsp:Transcript_97231/g.222791  ORF Transcript_97231/g.222791 Transcript_97231/m.222791 type:complete len:107 (+) Transcript_97231:526-846(+)